MKKIAAVCVAAAFAFASFAQEPSKTEKVVTDVKTTSKDTKKGVNEVKKGDVNSATKTSKDVKKDAKATEKSTKELLKSDKK